MSHEDLIVVKIILIQYFLKTLLRNTKQNFKHGKLKGNF